MVKILLNRKTKGVGNGIFPNRFLASKREKISFSETVMNMFINNMYLGNYRFNNLKKEFTYYARFHVEKFCQQDISILNYT